ncbi:histidine kinase [Trinickia violacea]|uniref:histidine kinase n=1 Tax=Trinickia violacea TaxID=2571746 RepID=A0A4P8ILF8_9BURK|nr:sensor histidine kinase [Trinickia violacea]QCP49738.1 histidine kinase [Trinickia violacea]
MKLFTKGLLLIAVPSIVELALLGVLFETQGQAAQAALWASRSKQVLYQASTIMDPLLRQASRLRAAIIVDDASFIDKHAVWIDLNDRLAQLQSLVADNPLQLDRVRRMREAVDVYRAQTNQVYEALADGERPIVLAAFEGTQLPPQIQEFRRQLDAFVAEESRLDGDRSEALSVTRAEQRNALIAAVAGSMLIWGLAALALAGNIGRRLAALTAKAERLGRGQSLGTPLSGDDEIAQLDAVLHQTSVRLRQAEGEQAALKEKLEARAEELTRLNDDLRQQTQDNEMFIYSVSHDLRSPLVNLQGFSRELQVSCDELRATLDAAHVSASDRARMADVLDGDLSESLHYLRTAVARSASIIDALLRISRAGRFEYQWQRVNVGRVVERIVERLQPTLDERGAALEVADLPPAWGDAGAVEQIFSHLIGNAVNYLDPERPGRIEIGALAAPEAEEPAEGGAQEAGAAVLTASASTAAATAAAASAAPGAIASGTASLAPDAPPMRTYYVRDNGLGIPAACMPKMFNAFQRLHGDVAQGDGIGLALVRRMTERHGGRVWVESAEGAGATFFVSLPEQPMRAPS